MLFRTNTEKSKDKTVSHAKDAGAHAVAAGEKAGETVLNAAGSLLHSLSEAVSPKAGAAAATAKERSHAAREAAAARTAHAREVAAERAVHARDAAVSGLDRGIDSAVPRAQEGVAHLGPKVDHARDSIVEDLLPKIQELLGSIQSAKDDILSKQDGPVAVMTGSPKKKSRKGGALITLGVLAAVGAAVAYYLSQQKGEEATDPWAGSVDRPVGGAPGVDTQVRQDTTLGTDASAAAPSAAVAAEGEGVVQPVEDDVPGTDPDARTGFGTDFGDTPEEHRPQA